MKKIVKNALALVLCIGMLLSAMPMVFATGTPEPQEEPHEHEYHTERVASTCKEYGYIETTCPCGYLDHDDLWYHGPHQYRAVVTRPTGTNAGYTTYTCTVCGKKYTDSEIPSSVSGVFQGGSVASFFSEDMEWLLNMSTGELTIKGNGPMRDWIFDPYYMTCAPWFSLSYDIRSVVIGYGVTNIGDESFIQCGALQSVYMTKDVEQIGMFNLTSETAITDIYYSGTEEDWAKIDIAPCNDLLQDITIHYNAQVPHAHNYVLTGETAPSCAQAGQRVHTCSYCGDTQTETIAKLKHTYTAEVTNPTINEQGYTTYTCSVCMDSYKDDYTPALSTLEQSGTCGDNATWQMDLETGTLTISGTGALYANGAAMARARTSVAATTPWAMFAEYITTVVLEDGITSISSGLFTGCENLEKAVIPASVVDIAEDAFMGCSDVTLYCKADSYAAQWAKDRALALVETEKPTFALTCGTAHPGGDVTVIVDVRQNPGFVATLLSLSYDADILTLTGVTCGNVFAQADMFPGNDLTAVPYKVAFMDALAKTNYTTDGTLVSFVFHVSEDAEPGATAITLSYDAESTFNVALDEVSFAIQNGSVDLVARMAGDANGDGIINLKDAAFIIRYLVGGWDVTVDEMNADCDADKEVTMADAVLIRRFLAGWNVTLV